MRYKPAGNETYRQNITAVLATGSSATMKAVRDELTRGLSGLLQTTITHSTTVNRDGIVIAGTPHSSPLIHNAGIAPLLQQAAKKESSSLQKRSTIKNVYSLAAIQT